MLLLGMKKCVFPMQMRRFVTLQMQNRTQIKIKAIYQERPESKCSNLSNPNYCAHRLINTNPNEEDRRVLPPLMSKRPPILVLPFINTFISYCIIRFTIDNEFRLKEFLLGAKQAIVVISNALATQNYDALDDIVYGKTVKILRHRVDRLTPKQRQLIATNSERLICFPGLTTIRQLKGNEKYIEIEVVGVNVQESNETSLIPQDMMFCYYTFRRKYANGIGGAWIARIVNHVA